MIKLLFLLSRDNQKRKGGKTQILIIILIWKFRFNLEEA
jgi:hypothetical protein